MLGYDELIGRLLRLDEDAYLQFDDGIDYQCVIVGGGALILMGFSVRVTHDIDVLDYAPKKLQDLMEQHDINAAVRAYSDCFPPEFEKRAVPLPLKTRKIRFFTLSLEDLVISKLCAGRDTDIRDITDPKILAALDWPKLDELAQEIKECLLSDRQISQFSYDYEEYKRRYGK